MMSQKGSNSKKKKGNRKAKSSPSGNKEPLSKEEQLQLMRSYNDAWKAREYSKCHSISTALVNANPSSHSYLLRTRASLQLGKVQEVLLDADTVIEKCSPGCSTRAKALMYHGCGYFELYKQASGVNSTDSTLAPKRPARGKLTSLLNKAFVAMESAVALDPEVTKVDSFKSYYQACRQTKAMSPLLPGILPRSVGRFDMNSSGENVDNNSMQHASTNTSRSLYDSGLGRKSSRIDTKQKGGSNLLLHGANRASKAKRAAVVELTVSESVIVKLRMVMLLASIPKKLVDTQHFSEWKAVLCDLRTIDEFAQRLLWIEAVILPAAHQHTWAVGASDWSTAVRQADGVAGILAAIDMLELLLDKRTRATDGELVASVSAAIKEIRSLGDTGMSSPKGESQLLCDQLLESTFSRIDASQPLVASFCEDYVRMLFKSSKFEKLIQVVDALLIQGLRDSDAIEYRKMAMQRLGRDGESQQNTVMEQQQKSTEEERDRKEMKLGITNVIEHNLVDVEPEVVARHQEIAESFATDCIIQAAAKAEEMDADPDNNLDDDLVQAHNIDGFNQSHPSSKKKKSKSRKRSRKTALNVGTVHTSHMNDTRETRALAPKRKRDSEYQLMQDIWQNMSHQDRESCTLFTSQDLKLLMSTFPSVQKFNSTVSDINLPSLQVYLARQTYRCAQVPKALGEDQVFLFPRLQERMSGFWAGYTSRTDALAGAMTLMRGMWNKAPLSPDQLTSDTQGALFENWDPLYDVGNSYLSSGSSLETAIWSIVQVSNGGLQPRYVSPNVFFPTSPRYAGSQYGSQYNNAAEDRMHHASRDSQLLNDESEEHYFRPIRCDNKVFVPFQVGGGKDVPVENVSMSDGLFVDNLCAKYCHSGKTTMNIGVSGTQNNCGLRRGLPDEYSRISSFQHCLLDDSDTVWNPRVYAKNSSSFHGRPNTLGDCLGLGSGRLATGTVDTTEIGLAFEDCASVEWKRAVDAGVEPGSALVLEDFEDLEQQPLLQEYTPKQPSNDKVSSKEHSNRKTQNNSQHHDCSKAEREVQLDRMLLQAEYFQELLLLWEQEQNKESEQHLSGEFRKQLESFVDAQTLWWVLEGFQKSFDDLGALNRVISKGTYTSIPGERVKMELTTTWIHLFVLLEQLRVSNGSQSCNALEVVFAEEPQRSLSSSSNQQSTLGKLKPVMEKLKDTMTKMSEVENQIDSVTKRHSRLPPLHPEVRYCEEKLRRLNARRGILRTTLEQLVSNQPLPLSERVLTRIAEELLVASAPVHGEPRVFVQEQLDPETDEVWSTKTILGLFPIAASQVDTILWKQEQLSALAEDERCRIETIQHAYRSFIQGAATRHHTFAFGTEVHSTSKLWPKQLSQDSQNARQQQIRFITLMAARVLSLGAIAAQVNRHQHHGRSGANSIALANSRFRRLAGNPTGLAASGGIPHTPYPSNGAPSTTMEAPDANAQMEASSRYSEWLRNRTRSLFRYIRGELMVRYKSDRIEDLVDGDSISTVCTWLIREKSRLRNTVEQLRVKVLGSAFKLAHRIHLRYQLMYCLIATSVENKLMRMAQTRKWEEAARSLIEEENLNDRKRVSRKSAKKKKTQQRQKVSKSIGDVNGKSTGPTLASVDTLKHSDVLPSSQDRNNESSADSDDKSMDVMLDTNSSDIPAVKIDSTAKSQEAVKAVGANSTSVSNATKSEVNDADVAAIEAILGLNQFEREIIVNALKHTGNDVNAAASLLVDGTLMEGEVNGVGGNVKLNEEVRSETKENKTRSKVEWTVVAKRKGGGAVESESSKRSTDFKTVKSTPRETTNSGTNLQHSKEKPMASPDIISTAMGLGSWPALESSKRSAVQSKKIASKPAKNSLKPGGAAISEPNTLVDKSVSKHNTAASKGPEESAGKSVKKAAKPNESDGKSVKKAAKPNESDGKSAKKAAKPNESDGKSVKKAAKPNESDGKSAKKAAKPNESDGKSVKKAAKPNESDGKSVKNDAKPNESDGKSVKKAAKPNESDGKPVKNDAKPNESDGKSVKNDAKQSKFVKSQDNRATKSLTNTAKQIEESTNSASNSVRVANNLAVPPDPGTVQSRNLSEVAQDGTTAKETVSVLADEAMAEGLHPSEPSKQSARTSDVLKHPSASEHSNQVESNSLQPEKASVGDMTEDNSMVFHAKQESMDLAKTCGNVEVVQAPNVEEREIQTEIARDDGAKSTRGEPIQHVQSQVHHPPTQVPTQSHGTVNYQQVQFQMNQFPRPIPHPFPNYQIGHFGNHPPPAPMLPGQFPPPPMYGYYHPPHPQYAHVHHGQRFGTPPVQDHANASQGDTNVQDCASQSESNSNSELRSDRSDTGVESTSGENHAVGEDHDDIASNQTVSSRDGHVSQHELIESDIEPVASSDDASLKSPHNPEQRTDNAPNTGSTTTEGHSNSSGEVDQSSERSQQQQQSGIQSQHVPHYIPPNGSQHMQDYGGPALMHQVPPRPPRMFIARPHVQGIAPHLQQSPPHPVHGTRPPRPVSVPVLHQQHVSGHATHQHVMHMHSPPQHLGQAPPQQQHINALQQQHHMNHAMSHQQSMTHLPHQQQMSHHAMSHQQQMNHGMMHQPMIHGMSQQQQLNRGMPLQQQQMNQQQQPINNGMPQQQPINNGVPQQQPINNGMPQQQPINNGMPQQQPMNNSMPQQQPMNNSMPQQQPMNNSMPQQQPMNNSMPQQQPMNNSMPQQQPMNNSMPQQQPMNNGMPQQQPMNNSMPQQQPVNNGMQQQQRMLQPQPQTNHVMPQQPQHRKVCPFYHQGTCRYGPGCRDLHT